MPIARWMRGHATLGRMFQHLLLDDQRRSFLNYAGICRLYLEHQDGSADHSDALWPILSLEIWCRCFLDGESATDVVAIRRPAVQKTADPGIEPVIPAV